MTVRYKIIPIDAGEEYSVKEEVTLSDGSVYTAVAEMTVPGQIIISYSVALSSYKDITIKLGTEAAFDVITGVYGGRKI